MLGVKSHNSTVGLSHGRFSVANGRLTSGEFTVNMKHIVPLDGNYSPDGSKQGTKAMFIGHLSSPDFFDVDNFSTASFRISEAGSDWVKGQLTIRGKSHTETVTDLVKTERNGSTELTGRLSFNRQKYGVSWAAPMKDIVLSDNIELNLHIVGAEQ